MILAQLLDCTDEQIELSYRCPDEQMKQRDTHSDNTTNKGCGLHSLKPCPLFSAILL